jgi:hypothetical protein
MLEIHCINLEYSVCPFGLEDTARLCKHFVGNFEQAEREAEFGMGTEVIETVGFADLGILELLV